MSNVFNNRRIAALSCAAAIGAGAFVVPSAKAATVEKPENGVCKFNMNSAERAYLDSLPHNVSTGDSAIRDRWLNAFERAFPQAAPVTEEFLELAASPSYVNLLNRNPEANTKIWVNKYVDQGIDASIAEFYFTYGPWNNVTTSGHDGYDFEALWGPITAAAKDGVIKAPSRDDRYPETQRIPDREGLIEAKTARFPSAPKDQITAWVDAYNSTEETSQARRVAEFQLAFDDARKACAQGGGIVLLPTDGTNPDKAKTQPSEPTAPATAQGEQVSKPTTSYSATTPTPKPTPKPGSTSTTVTVNANGTSTSVTTTSGHSESINVSATTSRDVSANSGASNTSKSTGSGTGAVIGIIVVLLVVLGGAGAAYAMMQ